MFVVGYPVHSCNFPFTVTVAVAVVPAALITELVADDISFLAIYIIFSLNFES